MEKELFERLNRLGITYENFEHEALFTVEQARAIRATLPAGHAKNLFLKDDKKQFWLVIAHADTQVPLKKLGKSLQAPQLRFAQPELLKKHLGVEPGSVTPFGLINDLDRRVGVVLDTKLYGYETVGFHPLRNTATTLISPQSLEKFFNELGSKWQIIDFEVLSNA